VEKVPVVAKTKANMNIIAKPANIISQIQPPVFPVVSLVAVMKMMPLLVVKSVLSVKV
jgi:hypothetical protein